MNNHSFKTLILLFISIHFFSQLSAKVTYYSDLKVTEDELGNVLQWATSMESNTKHFVIEKSTDNVAFSEVGTLDAHVNSNENKSYFFVDVALSTSNAKHYYRLRQVDLDGTFSHGKVASLTKKLSNHFLMENIQFSETPDKYILSYKSLVAGEMNLDILNTNDRSVVHTETYTASVGFHNIQLDMTHLDAGDYELVFTLASERETIAIHKASTVNTPNSMMSRKATNKVNRN